jgi:isoquinoline 1-oxidoreductase alpha subunit
VQIDGKQFALVRHKVSRVAARKVTIEGLRVMDPSAQKAWFELDTAVGYRQAGQIMNAAALLARTPKPSDPDIDLR